MLTKIPSAITNWFDAGVAKVCVYVDSEEALLELPPKEKPVVLSWPLLGTRAFYSSSMESQHLPAWHLSHWLQKILTR